jgi:hypothetical protein
MDKKFTPWPEFNLNFRHKVKTKLKCLMPNTTRSQDRRVLALRKLVVEKYNQHPVSYDIHELEYQYWMLKNRSPK